MVYHKLYDLDHEYVQKIKILFAEYPNLIAASFDDLWTSNGEFWHKFELATDQNFFQKLKKV